MPDWTIESSRDGLLSDSDDEIKHLKKLRSKYTASFRLLEEQEATYGVANIPVRLQNEIDLTRDKIKLIDEQLTQFSIGTHSSSMLNIAEHPTPLTTRPESLSTVDLTHPVDSSSSGRALMFSILTVAFLVMGAFIIFVGLPLISGPQTQINMPTITAITNDRLIIARSPEDIVVEAQSVPIIQRDKVFQSYFGVEVEWPGRVRNVEIKGEEILAVSFYYDTKSYFVIFCEFGLEEYPVLKTLKGGETFTIRGIILELKACYQHSCN